jgi:hypothetical protein
LLASEFGYSVTEWSEISRSWLYLNEKVQLVDAKIAIIVVLPVKVQVTTQLHHSKRIFREIYLQFCR